MERPVVIGWVAGVHKLRRLYWRFTSQDCRRTGLGHEKSTRLLCSPDSAQAYREPSMEYYHVQEQRFNEGGTGTKPLCRLTPMCT